MGWDPVVTQYVSYLKAIGRPKTTITLRRNQLSYLGRSIAKAPCSISHDDLIEWLAVHSAWGPETRRSYCSAIRGFYAWAVENARVENDPAHKLPQVRVPRAAARPTPDKVLAAAITTAAPRTQLMLRLAAEAGLRRAEIAKVHTRDLRHGPDGAQLLVHGKGGRERVVPVTDELAAAVAAGAGGHTAGGGNAGWLFPSERGGHVTAHWVGLLCSRALPGEWTVHTARHRFASRAYRGSKDLRAVQELLGHATPVVTQRYIAVDNAAMRAAMMAAVAD